MRKPRIIGVVTQRESGRTRYLVSVPIADNAWARVYVFIGRDGKRLSIEPYEARDMEHVEHAEVRAHAWWAVCKHIADRNRAA